MPTDLSDWVSDCLSDSPGEWPARPVGLGVGLPVGLGVGFGVGLPVGNPRHYLTSPNRTSPTSRTSATHHARTRERGEQLDLLELLEHDRSSALVASLAAATAEAGAGGGGSSDTPSQTTPRHPWKSPPNDQRKTDMSKNREESRPTRANGVELLEMSARPGSRPLLPRAQRIVAVLELPCRSPGCAEAAIYRAQTLCRAHYLLARRRCLGGDYPRTMDGRGAPTLERVTYHGAHARALERHGRADGYRCELCPARAAQWALPPSLEAETCERTGLRYSCDPEDYMPLCASCHSTLDRANPPRPGMVPLPLPVTGYGALRPVIRREPWPEVER